MTLEQGSILNDRYRIDGRLGKGGMGAVYLAFDQVLEIRVALKENLNLNPESERQFRREATLLASLRHPNLPRVTDHFILEDRQYLVMDYIEGVDLHTRIHKQPATPDEVVRWAESMCSALTYLHTRQPPIIHRDVKPANLKLQPDGNVVLVDFGIAKVFEEAQTATGARGLTPGYSPPEQYGGEPTDSRSDQYSLAATIYNLLTNKQPADSIQRMLGKETLVPLRQLNPDVPEHVEAAVERAMSLDQDHRFPDVASFGAALQGKLQLETIRATLAPPPPAKRSSKGIWIGAAALAAVVLFGGLALGFGVLLPALQDSLQSTPTSEAVVILPPDEPATVTPDPGTPPVFETPEPSSTPSPTIPPTPTTAVIGGGGRIAFVSDREDGSTLQVWTMNGDGSDPRQLTFGPGDKTQPRWSPDGSRVLYVTHGGKDDYGNDLGLDIFVFSADRSGEPVNLTRSPGDDLDPAWSPDGSRIAFTSTRVNDLKQVFVMQVACGAPQEGCSVTRDPSNFSAGYAVEYSPAWSPDGSRLAVIASINGAPGRIFIRHAGGGEPKRYDVQDRIIGADHPDWSPDGDYLLFDWLVKRGKQEIYVSTVASPALDPSQLTNSLGNKDPRFSPDGQIIVFTSTRDQDPEIYIMTTSGTGQQNITNSRSSRDFQPDWQPAIPE